MESTVEFISIIFLKKCNYILLLHAAALNTASPNGGLKIGQRAITEGGSITTVQMVSSLTRFILSKEDNKLLTVRSEAVEPKLVKLVHLLITGAFLRGYKSCAEFAPVEGTHYKIRIEAG